MSHLLRRKTPVSKALAWLCAFGFALFVCAVGVDGAGREDQSEQSASFSKCWEYAAVPDLTVSPVSDETNVYFLDNENKLIAVQLSTGQKVWSAEIAGDAVSNLLIGGDSVFIAARVRAGLGDAAKAVLWSMSRQTGITEWRTEISSSPSVAIGRSSRGVLALGSDGMVVTLDGKGEVVWRSELGAPISSDPYFGDFGVAVGTSKNEVVSIGGGDGRVEVLWKSPHAPTAVYLKSRTRLFVGDERGNLFSVPAGGNPYWRFRNGARISRVLSNNTGYVAVSDDNFVYYLSRSGDVKWKRRLPGRVEGAPLVLRGAFVVSIVGAGALYMVNLKDGKILNKIETGDDASLRLAGLPDSQGFVMAGVNGLIQYGRPKCLAK